jgi:opacity protein-like surface antigen
MVGCLVLGLTGAASAEPYLAGFAGVAITPDVDLKTELDLNGVSILDGTFKDIEVDSTLVFGGKAGYFFSGKILGGNLGIELDASHFRADVDSQTVRFSGQAFGLPVDIDTTVQEAHADVTTVGLTALYRLALWESAALPNGRVQPYIGVGVAAFIATFETRTSVFPDNVDLSETDVEPGIQAIGGLKVFLTRHLALFAEYKFFQTTEFTFRFEETQGPITETARDRSDLTGHQVYGGIAVHW